MTHLPLLDELAIIAALAVVVTVLLARLRLPTVAGLLAAGALLGPLGLALVHSVQAIEALAELGVVLLLFTIGLEFSFSRLRVVLRQAALGGALQVLVTTAVIALIARALGQPVGRSVFYGFACALSSTAIVLRALAERRELDAPHGRFIVGTLLFQDLCVVPMVLIVPYLSGGGAGGALSAVAIALGKAALVMVALVLAARVAVPTALKWVAASRSREVFLLAIIGLCIGMAWLTATVGLSLALGAFLAGMVLADGEYGHRALGEILPLRDAFVSIFFVSLGMLFDVRVVLAQPLLVAGLLLGFLLIKGALAVLSALVMGFPSRAAWLAGTSLAQFGEFGFVVCRLGQKYQVVDERALRPLLAAGIASMFLTPLLARLAPHITAGERLLAPFERLLGVRSIDAIQKEKRLEGHVVVVGYGTAGRIAAGALAACGSAFLVLEQNVDNVRAGKERGLPVYYGDATSEEALGHAELPSARLLVLLINDPNAAERIVATARRVAPAVPILIRTRYWLERDALFRLGATTVVSDEVEGALEIILCMLLALDVPRPAIDEQIRAVRQRAHPGEETAAAGA